MNGSGIVPNAPQRNSYGPLTPGELFERTFALLGKYPGLFFGIVLVVIGVEIVVGGAMGATGIWTGHYGTDTASVAKALFVAPLALLGAVIIYVVTQIIQGALFLATRAKLMEAPMTIGEACQRASEKTGRLVGISILVALRLIGYMILLDIAAGVLIIVAFTVSGLHHAAGQNSFHWGHGGAALGVGVFLIAFLLAIAVAYIVILFWLVLRYALAIPAALEENLPVTDAIRRSIALSRGSKGRLIALFVAIGVVSIALAAITIPMQLMATHGGLHLTVLLFTAAAIRILFSWGLIAFMGVASALCYFDLRVRKEGFGLELSVTPPPVPPALPDGPIEDLPIS